MDLLTLKGLEYEGKHGYYEEERREGNRFEVDLTFHTDLRKAGETDQLEHTLDYQMAEKIVRTVMMGPSVHLIETLVHRIGEQLFSRFPGVSRLEVSIRKLSPPLRTRTRHAEITMTWQR